MRLDDHIELITDPKMPMQGVMLPHQNGMIGMIA